MKIKSLMVLLLVMLVLAWWRVITLSKQNELLYEKCHKALDVADEAIDIARLTRSKLVDANVEIIELKARLEEVQARESYLSPSPVLNNDPAELTYATYDVPDAPKHSWSDVVIHHSGSCDDTVESMRRYHVEERGWNGIGYHIVITAEGELVFTERYLEQRSGAHTRGHNEKLGVCVVGNFDEKPPTERQLRQLNKVLSGVSGKIHTHGELGKTACPGKYLKKWVDLQNASRKGI